MHVIPRPHAEVRAILPKSAVASGCDGRRTCFSPRSSARVVSTRKHQAFQGSKLLLLQPLVAQQRTLVPSGSSVVAIDAVGAGLDEFVMFTQGSSARLAAADEGHPGRRDRRRHRGPRRSRRDDSSRGRDARQEADGGGDRRRGDLAALDAPRRPGHAGRRDRAERRRAPAARRRRSRRPPTGHGVFRTVDEAVAAAAAAQVRVAEMGLEERGRMIARDPADLRRAGRRTRPDGARRDPHRPPRAQDRQAAGDEVRARRRGDAERRAQRPDRAVRHRARALGRDRHGAARHPLGADDGEQRGEHPGGRQHGGVQPAPGRRPRGRLRAAALQPDDRGGDRRRRT